MRCKLLTISWKQKYARERATKILKNKEDILVAMLNCVHHLDRRLILFRSSKLGANTLPIFYTYGIIPNQTSWVCSRSAERSSSPGTTCWYGIDKTPPDKGETQGAVC